MNLHVIFDETGGGDPYWLYILKKENFTTVCKLHHETKKFEKRSKN
jgi:hypothetical protein